MNNRRLEALQNMARYGTPPERAIAARLLISERDRQTASGAKASYQHTAYHKPPAQRPCNYQRVYQDPPDRDTARRAWQRQFDEHVQERQQRKDILRQQQWRPRPAQAAYCTTNTDGADGGFCGPALAFFILVIIAFIISSN